jgi:mannose-6-phosphate isomerase-like protein (cupin superfamily)
MSGWSVARLDEIPLQDDGRAPWRPVRHHLGIKAFGVNAYVGRKAGDRVVNEHDEDTGQEELYVVLSGRATFTIDGEEVDAPPGTIVFVRPEGKRTAVAAEAETTVLAIGGKPGEAYVVSGWELWAPLNPLYQDGRYAEAADAAAAIVDEHPGYPGLLYNLACCESLAGRKDAALEHLRRSLEIDGSFREYARGDSDFAAIREEPGFAELVS